MDQNIAGVDLENLEQRVQQAAQLIMQLKAERDELRRSRDELRGQLGSAEQTAKGLDEWKVRAQEAEARLERYAQERSSLARRVEQMLDKLRAVEEEKLGATVS